MAPACGLSGATLWQWGVFHVEKPLNWVMTLGLNHRTQPVGHCQRVAWIWVWYPKILYNFKMQFDGYIVHFWTNTNISIRISHQHQCHCHNHHQHHQYVIRMRSSASSLFIAPRHNHPYFHIAYTPAIAWFEGIINTWLSWFSEYMHLWLFVYIYIYICIYMICHYKIYIYIIHCTVYTQCIYIDISINVKLYEHIHISMDRFRVHFAGTAIFHGKTNCFL